MPKGGKQPGAGRPKGAKNKQPNYLRELAQTYTDQAVFELVNIMTNGENESARIAAAKELLDRGYGKSPQAITSDDGGALKVIFEVVKK